MKDYIPKITDEELSSRAERIKPVVREQRKLSGDVLYYIKPVDLKTVAFTWDAKPDKRAKGLKPIATITTYHTYGYYGFFKPSIAEVLAQIPEQYLKDVVAFETNGPDTVQDLNRHQTELDDGYHVAQTILYGKE